MKQMKEGSGVQIFCTGREKKGKEKKTQTLSVHESQTDSQQMDTILLCKRNEVVLQFPLQGKEVVLL